MFLLVSIIALIAFCIVDSMDKRFYEGERYAEMRTSDIISAIESSSYDITSCAKNISREEIDFYERFNKDTENERVFRDNYGKYKRERLVYDGNGNVIAKEIVEVAE